MYGTISRVRVKPGHLQQLLDAGAENEREAAGQKGPGFLFVFKLDRDEDELYMVAIAESKADYQALSESPEMHQQYVRMAEHYEGEPGWFDGQVIFARVNP